MSDTRYPYTYACDLIRGLVGPGLSRSHAAQIRQGIAEAIGRRFSGKECGSWRIVYRIGSPPRNVVYWENELRKRGACLMKSFMAWVDRTKPAVLGDQEVP